MTEHIAQRLCIKFCQKLDDMQAQTIEKIQKAFGDDATGETKIKEWYDQFKDGRISVDSEPRYGRSSTSKNDQMITKVRRIVYEDRRVTIEGIVAGAGISYGSIQSVHSAHVDKIFPVKQNAPLVRQASHSLDMGPGVFSQS
ncbi:protein GVQW3-like [Octopus sinensis]|uniref:Protein GVQW3-like n=1 Tax=Octopus sinensis TaxID=2607531 RepID=A0A6P7SUG1_9MOLL|nr:protein GVQW3-like [Octopus sinensis]